MSLHASAKAFREEVLSFIWRQWGQMGLSAPFAHEDVWCQDPEALLVFSLEAARRDPRMFDEILDWLTANGRSLLRQRVENLLARDPDAPRPVIEAALARTLPAISRRSRETQSTLDSTGPTPLFEGELTEAAAFGESEPIFLRFGLVRPPFRRSRKSRELDLLAPFNMPFRLRAIFGPGSRSEAIRYLLLRGDQGGTTVEIAEAIALSRPNVQQALEGLSAAGICIKHPRNKKELMWRLDVERWQTWLELDESRIPRWIDWPAAFAGLATIWRWIHAPQRESESPYIRSSRARQLMEQAAPLIANAGIKWHPADPQRYPGEGYLPAFEHDLATLGTALNPRT
ncbi:MAG TPA: hypothetical protein V6D00_08185 [Pantanalinema sp.]